MKWFLVMHHLLLMYTNRSGTSIGCPSYSNVEVIQVHSDVRIYDTVLPSDNILPSASRLYSVDRFMHQIGTLINNLYENILQHEAHIV